MVPLLYQMLFCMSIPHLNKKFPIFSLISLNIFSIHTHSSVNGLLSVLNSINNSIAIPTPITMNTVNHQCSFELTLCNTNLIKLNTLYIMYPTQYTHVTVNTMYIIIFIHLGKFSFSLIILYIPYPHSSSISILIIHHPYKNKKPSFFTRTFYPSMPIASSFKMKKEIILHNPFSHKDSSQHTLSILHHLL